MTWRLLGHLYADADIRIVLSAVAAFDPTVSLHMRGLEGLLGKKATSRLSEAALEQQAFKASGRLCMGC